jgi:hypothetical protein
MDDVIHIRAFKHRATDLWAAMSDDLPGFIVHTHSSDELAAKIAPALVQFQRALGRPVHNVSVERDDPVPGFPPNDSLARAEHPAEAV